MDNKGSNVQGNKISRLDFLKLLGAGAIGYLAYRAGFINKLFGNAAAASGAGGRILNTTTQQRHAVAGSPSSSSAVLAAEAAGRLDEDGILMMATPKLGGYSYRFNTTQDPSKDIRLDVSDSGSLEIKQEGGVKLMRFMSHNPSIGDGSNTVRLHIFTEDRTFICRPNKILDNTNAISAKLGGGEHTLGIPKNDEASCWNVNWYYNPTRINVITFEYIHPDYEHGHTVKLYNTYKPLGDRWFGCKVVSMVRPDQSARDIVTYFNEDPIDLATGLPKNDGWKKYFEFTHTGQGEEYNMPHTWGGAKSTWRNDQLTSIDVAYMNHREIIALNNNMV